MPIPPNALSLLLISCLSAFGATVCRADEIHHAQGEMAGEVTATTVLLQSRLTAIPGPELNSDGDIPGAVGVAGFEFGTSDQLENSQRTALYPARPESDFIVRVKLNDLQPATKYYYRLIYGLQESELKRGPIRQFQTLSTNDSAAPLTFVMGSCQNYAFFMHGKNGKGSSASAADRQAGFPAYAAMLALKPDFFIGTGDIVYYDHPASTAAQTLPELRRKWHEQFRLPRLIEFFGQTSAYWSKDDHDFRYNDADLENARKPDAATGIEIFREQMPIHPSDDQTSPTYRTHRVHKHLQLWFVEGRDYRSPNRMPDGPDKSLWGIEQRNWLKATLLESDAEWKIIITPTPMVGPDSRNKRDNHTNLQGFRHEAGEFLQWLQQQRLTDSVMTFCGDRHWQYHSIHPLGLQEFSCGALNDENAILGSFPGTANSTDPEGKIQQPFHYSKPSGGFLHVRIQSDTTTHQPELTITFHNDEGQSLYSVKRNPEQQASRKNSAR